MVTHFISDTKKNIHRVTIIILRRINARTIKINSAHALKARVSKHVERERDGIRLRYTEYGAAAVRIMSNDNVVTQSRDLAKEKADESAKKAEDIVNTSKAKAGEAETSAKKHAKGFWAKGVENARVVGDEVKSAAESMKQGAFDAEKKIEETLGTAKDDTADAGERAKEKSKGFWSKGGENVHAVTEKIQAAADSAKDKVIDAEKSVEGAFGDARETIEETAEDAKDKKKGVFKKLKEKLSPSSKKKGPLNAASLTVAVRPNIPICGSQKKL